jgi:3-hydroxypropanoate dehydrogenase
MSTSETSIEADVNRLFLEAHTHNAWLDRPVPDALLRRVYEAARMAPTGANCQPLRVVYVKSAAAKEKLKPALAPGNVDKTMAAPATAIIAYDLEFYEKMPKLFPARDMRASFLAMPEEKRERSAFMNGTLGGAYMILAARALGLDVGPMGGFDNAKVDAAFFPDGKWRSNFLINIGYGDVSGVRPRAPRLDFDEACRIE